MEIEITHGVTVDEGVDDDGCICINVSGTYSEAYAYLNKQDVEKLLSMFDK